MKDQLKLFGISDQQKHFTSEKFGVLDFIPTKETRPLCEKCILKRFPNECIFAPCRGVDRKDNMNDYFSIHQFPKTK